MHKLLKFCKEIMPYKLFLLLLQPQKKNNNNDDSTIIYTKLQSSFWYRYNVMRRMADYDEQESMQTPGR